MAEYLEKEGRIRDPDVKPPHLGSGQILFSELFDGRDIARTSFQCRAPFL